MEEIRYHPLVDVDTDGKIKRPVFASTRKDQMQHHSFWLEECISGAFRLCSAEEMPGTDLEGLELYCPSCGKKLKALTDQSDGTRHALYICTNCR